MLCDSQLEDIFHFTLMGVITVAAFFFSLLPCGDYGQLARSSNPNGSNPFWTRWLEIQFRSVGTCDILVHKVGSNKNAHRYMLYHNERLLAGWSPSIMYKSIYAKVMIGPFHAKHNFGLCSFLTSSAHEAGRELFATKFRCPSVSNRQLFV